MISKCIAFALTAALASGVVAQEGPAAPIAAAEKAGGAAEIYQSAFSNYKSFREPEVMSWRASNDQVRDGGGVSAHDMGKLSGGAAMPAHDMQSMKPEAAGTGTPEHGRGPAKDAGGMEGHDMGKMDKMDKMGSAPVRESKNGAAAKASVQLKAKPAHDVSKMKPGSGAERDLMIAVLIDVGNAQFRLPQERVISAPENLPLFGNRMNDRFQG